MKLISIAAIGQNNELGKDNDLLWHLPEDFKRFKKMTTGHYIIMGRKTFESFPKPLPNRTHVVITRQENYPSQQCIVVKNIDEALEVVKNQELVFVIGGGEIYRQFMPFADELELTEVEGEFEADTYFPDVNDKDWELVNEEHHPKDEKHKYAFTFKTYQRKARS